VNLLLLLLLLLPLPLSLLMLLLQTMMHLIPTRKSGNASIPPVTALLRVVLLTRVCHMPLHTAAAEWQKDDVLHVHSACGRFFLKFC
jgi:hypothetical protein